MLCDINAASADETAQLIVDAGGEAEAMPCDATDWASVKAARDICVRFSGFMVFDYA
jgi:hypothetical protein